MSCRQSANPRIAVFFLLMLGIANTTQADEEQKCRGNTVLLIGEKTVTVEIAATEKERRYGLMFRSSMGADCGMLFVFKNEGQRIFTMRNTLIPLDIAFIAKTGNIREILTMQPGVDRYPSSVQSQFALELNAGWFDTNNIALNAEIKIGSGNEQTALDSLLP